MAYLCCDVACRDFSWINTPKSLQLVAPFGACENHLKSSILRGLLGMFLAL